MADTSELTWRMAEAAWRAYYCHARGDTSKCVNCRDLGECFELSGDFKRDDNADWYASAEAALDVFLDTVGQHRSVATMHLEAATGSALAYNK